MLPQPVLGTWRPNYQGRPEEAIRWNEAVRRLVLENSIKKVFLICRWDVAVFGRPSGKLDTLLASTGETTTTVASAFHALQVGLQTMLDDLNAHGVEFVLLVQPPTLQCHPTRTLALRTRLFGQSNEPASIPLVYEQERGKLAALLSSASGSGVRVIEPRLERLTGKVGKISPQDSKYMPKSADPPLSQIGLRSTRPIYLDTNHLTPLGAECLFGDQIREELTLISVDVP